MPTTTYRGLIQAPKAKGTIQISIPTPDSKNRWISGQMRIGSYPLEALTGFGGKSDGSLTFQVSGENTRGRGVMVENPATGQMVLDKVHIAATIRGTVTADRQRVSGVIDAVINGAEQPEWTFNAAAPGVELAAVPPENGGDVFALAPTEPPGMLERIPDAWKIGGVLAAIGGTAALIYRRFKK